MNCASCGSQSPERAKFCLECGAAFAPRCASCGPLRTRFDVSRARGFSRFVGHDEEIQLLETAPLELFRLNAELPKRATLGLERWLLARG